PRRVGVPRPVPVRRDENPQRPRRLRPGWATLLPWSAPRASRDQDPVSGAAAATRLDRGERTRRTPSLQLRQRNQAHAGEGRDRLAAAIPAGQRVAGHPLTSPPYAAPVTDLERARKLSDQVASRVDERLYGMREPLRLVLVGILTGSHILIDDVPGVGKTTLVRMLASLLGLSFRRVQFTPDLMPTDITGASILNLRTNDFEFRPGPVFTNIILADEINRATP